MNIEGAIFEAALMLNSAERREFLERAFSGDSEGLERMTALLATAGESSAFFMEATEHRTILADELVQQMPEDEVDADFQTASEGPGTRIGTYLLLSRIGEGGCGVVYEAEQLEPVRRRVALKIIRLGMDTEKVIARFRAERQALALMDHPNIARVFDAGSTAAGRPYFVMEMVRGERITAASDREALGIEARIHLFIQVCNAILHAHQKGVIHRDIKPSNVLVTQLDGEPLPKVIDFGIAKATDEAELYANLTRHDQLLGTPVYMSPEQVDMGGIDIDTRSDIYSLGALLHELLSGRPPFDAEELSRAGFAGMRRIILEQDPPLLSRMLGALPADERAAIAANRGEESSRLVARLRGDLDWIVRKAMTKERDQRYPTVGAFVADLQRYLRHEPVHATATGRRYVLGKFIRRNRAACISGAFVAVALLVGFWVSMVMYFKEHEALAEQARLRGHAQARANVAQAAVMLSEGKITEADALLQESPVESIEPSQEAAGVFRALGNWNAFYGRWPQAVQCYSLLNQANRLDRPSDIVEQCEIIAIASAFLADNDVAGYEKFRDEMLDTYLPAANSLQAEHVIQACLLTPASPEILSRLRAAADVCVGGPPPPTGRWPDWEAFAMTLYYHRLGLPKETIEWGEKSLAFPITSDMKSRNARIASTLALLAVARHRLGDTEAPADDLRRAKGLIVDGMRIELSRDPSGPGIWYCWVIAQKLLGEASAEVGLPVTASNQR